MTQAQSFPRLCEGEFAVVCAEALTGIVLSTTGTRAIGSAERYRVFTTIQEAKNCAKRLSVENPLWECLVLDHTAKPIETYRDEDALLRTALSERPRSWWSRWFGK
jgi:hypothetical protein